MIVYNVTIKVDKSISEEWLQWMKKEHIPEVCATNCFTHATIFQLLEIDDSEGPTYAIQYHAESKGNYNFYIEKFAPLMKQKGYEKWGNKFIAFRSVMHIIQ